MGNPKSRERRRVRMTITEKKKRMKSFRDFYGGDMISLEDINKAKTNKDLALCCQKHYRFLEDQQTDALAHMDTFRRVLDLL